jgi:hypothetical protein
MGFAWPLETEPAEALPIKANDFLGAWQTGANSPSGRQSAQSTAHASPNAVWGERSGLAAHERVVRSRIADVRFLYSLVYQPERSFSVAIEPAAV